MNRVYPHENIFFSKMDILQLFLSKLWNDLLVWRGFSHRILLSSANLFLESNISFIHKCFFILPIHEWPTNLLNVFLFNSPSMYLSSLCPKGQLTTKLVIITTFQGTRASIMCENTKKQQQSMLQITIVFHVLISYEIVLVTFKYTYWR